jgi:hypothetical protein
MRRPSLFEPNPACCRAAKTPAYAQTHRGLLVAAEPWRSWTPTDLDLILIKFDNITKEKLLFDFDFDSDFDLDFDYFR